MLHIDAEDIVTICKRHGITITRLCDEAGIDVSTFRRWRLNLRRRGPTIEIVERVNDALERLVAERFAEETAPKPRSLADMLDMRVPKG